jgi:hypothetical protein
MADDDAVYIDIVPRVDEGALSDAESRIENAFDKAGDAFGKIFSTDLGQELKDKLNDAVADVADNIGGTIGGKIGDGLKSATDHLGIDISSGLGKEVSETLHDAIGDAFSSIGDKGALRGVGKKLADDLAGEFGGALSRTISGQVGQISDAIGLDLGKTFDQLKDVTEQFKQHSVSGTIGAVGNVLNTAQEFAERHGQSGAAGALGEAAKIGSTASEGALLGAPFGPIGAGVGGTVFGAVQGVHDLMHRPPISRAPDMAPVRQALGIEGGDYGVSLPLGFAPSGGQALLGGGSNDAIEAGGEGPLGHAKKYGVGSVLSPAPMSGVPKAAAGPTSTNQMDVAAGTVNISGASVSVPGASSGGGSSATGATGGSKRGGASSTGSAKPGKATSSPSLGNALFGYATGGVVPGPSPGYDNRIGVLPNGSMVGLEGGEGIVKDDAMSQPGVPQLVSNLNTHFDKGGRVGGGKSTGGSSNAPAAASSPGRDSALSGDSDMATNRTAPASFSSDTGQTRQPGRGKPQRGKQPAPGEGGPEAPPKPGKEVPQTFIPTGHGKGFGLTGGGLIGFGEDAISTLMKGIGQAAPGVGAGGMGGAVTVKPEALLGDFAASAWKNLAEPEINRAISYVGKVAPTLAVEMPIDEFWLSDSKLSNPSHSWFGKLGLSLVGEHLNAKNFAGLTKAPLSTPVSQQQQQGPQPHTGPAIHIENQHNHGNVEHEQNNMALATQLGSTSSSPTAYTPRPEPAQRHP